MRPSKWIALRRLAVVALPCVSSFHRLDARPAGRSSARHLDQRRDADRMPARREMSSNGATSSLVAWKGSRFAFDAAGLTAAVRYEPDPKQWDMRLARQCGIIRTSAEDLLNMSGPHVNHKQVGETIEATPKWTDPDHFQLDGVCYTRVAD